MTEQRYNQLEADFGRELAIFYSCLIEDFPYIVSFADGKKDYFEYHAAVCEAGNDTLDGEPLRFSDGWIDVMSVLENSMSEHERHINVWGTGGEENPYSEEDYKRLDRLFLNYSLRLANSGGYDALQEDILRYCCKCRLVAEKNINKQTQEGASLAKIYDKIVQDNLSSENLRRKDEIKTETVRIDFVVDALEKAGYVKNGKILPYDKLLDVLLERLGAIGGKPSHKFPYTLDAADQMIQIIINNERANDGLAELSDLPEEMRLDENVSPEFADKPNSIENDLYGKLGIMRWGK